MKPDGRARAILLVAAFLIFAAGAFWGLPSGKAVAGGLVILDGGLPYRDFWTMYAPGQFYTVAALFLLFGRELLVQAIAVAVVRAGSAVAFFVLMRRLGAGRGLASSLSAVFVLMFWTTAPELTDYPPALLLVLLAVERAARYFNGHGSVHLRWAGLWLGLAAWFKHDVAAYVAVGLAVALWLSWLLTQNRYPVAWRSPASSTLTIGAFALAAFMPIALWTAWTAGAAAWNDLILFPLTTFSGVRSDPFPSLIPDVRPLAGWLSDPSSVSHARSVVEYLSTWMVLHAPVAIFLGGLLIIGVAHHRLEAGALAQLVLALACMPFFWSAAHVQQNTHPYSLAVFGAGAGVVLWSQLGAGSMPRALIGPLAAAVAIYAGALVADSAIKAALVPYEWAGSRPLDLPGFRGVRVPARLYDAFHPVGRFFREHVPEGEPVYTGLLRHDAIVINNTLLYAIAGRPACCGYTELHPGVGDREPVQRDIIRRLEERGVRAIVLWEFGWSKRVMEARKAHTMAAVPDAGATILDRYIADNFQVLESHGEYHVLWRRGVLPPERIP